MLAGDDRWCLTDREARAFLHWQVEQQAGAERAVLDVAEDRDRWKIRATTPKPSPVGVIVGSVAAALAVGLGAGFGLGFYLASPRTVK